MKSRQTNIFATVLDKVHQANDALMAEGLLPAGIDQSRVVVEPPREASHGDMATNAAMVLAKDAGRKPRELADAIAEKLRADALIEKVDVAGPGFINLTLKPTAWLDALRAVLDQGADYGKSGAGQGTRVNVEYVSANPTGPMHVGHCRGAVFGDALANLLAAAGFDVTREYYINDAGAQVDVLVQSAFLRYREALGEDIGAIPEGFYPGDYLKPVGEALVAEYGNNLLNYPVERWLPIVRARAIDMMMANVRDDLKALNVTQDVFFSERSLIANGTDHVAQTIAYLRAQGNVYEGRLPPPKGAPVEDWEDREQTLFRSTDFGDDIDRPLMKSDGSYTYFASDIAYHKNKLDRGFKSMIDVWGADHGGYIKRMKAAVSALSGGTGELDVKVVQLVKLLRGGEPVKMSKRAGEFVTLREVRRRSRPRRGPLHDALPQERRSARLRPRQGDRAVQRQPGVLRPVRSRARPLGVPQRARSVLLDLPHDPKARAEKLRTAPIERLEDPGELALMRRLALYPRLLEAAALAHEPHRIAFYLYDLASEFHSLWNKGMDAPHLRFIIANDPQLTVARLALVQGVVTVLASGLSVLGVEAPEEMR